jgi:tetratricopeptide (TPR) repeat protein
MTMPRHLLFIAIASALLTATARADEWVTPSEVTITSPTGIVRAVITPAPDGRSGAHAKIVENGKPRSFVLAAKWMPVDSLVFDDGTLLALDHWHALGAGDVATLYGRDGRVRWKKTLVELIGQQLADHAVHSVSSIWWRRTPLEWTLAKDGKSIAITLFDENQLRITLADGAVAIVPVAKLPDDPPRLLNRARALASAGHDAEAIPLVERAMAKDPDFLEAFVFFAETLQRSNDHARVVAAFERASPRWTLPAKDPYGIANIHVAWAKSLVALGRKADAERVLDKATQAAPTYSNPALGLAQLYADDGKSKEADATLDAFEARLVSQTNLDTYSIMAIGDFYKNRNDHAKAIAHYSAAYKRDQVTNQFLYAAMAESYEKLGKLADAIRIVEQLIAHFEKLGAPFANDAAEARTNLARLRAKKP